MSTFNNMLPTSRHIPITEESDPKTYHELTFIMTQSMYTLYKRDGFDALKRVLRKTQLRYLIEIMNDGIITDRKVVEAAVVRTIINHHNESAKYLGKPLLKDD